MKITKAAKEEIKEILKNRNSTESITFSIILFYREVIQSINKQRTKNKRQWNVIISGLIPS